MDTVRKPDHAGIILTEEVMAPCGLSQEALAEKMGVSRKTVNEICRGRRRITVDTAMMLARVFGNSDQFWLNIQMSTDRWESLNDKKRGAKIDTAQPL